MRLLFTFLAFIVFIQLQSQAIVLKIINPQLSEKIVTYDVVVEEFTNMIGMQYGLTYDPAKMDFHSISNIYLPNFTLNDINTNLEGQVILSWINTSLDPITMVDGSILYKISFECKDIDNRGEVCISENFLASEFINANLDIKFLDIVDDCFPEIHRVALGVNSNSDMKLPSAIKILGLHDNGILKIQSELSDEMKVSIFDFSGKNTIRTKTINIHSGENSILVDHTFNSGVYIVNLSGQGYSFSKKVIVY